jgi:hypothetical protein
MLGEINCSERGGFSVCAGLNQHIADFQRLCPRMIDCIQIINCRAIVGCHPIFGDHPIIERVQVVGATCEETTQQDGDDAGTSDELFQVFHGESFLMWHPAPSHNRMTLPLFVSPESIAGILLLVANVALRHDR